jgi:PTS system galactitol-specific IIA component
VSLAELVTDRRLLLPGLAAGSAEEALRAVAGRLLETGYVHPSFPDAVVAREVEFPTGLPTEPIGVAIPHSDPEHVVTTTVALATLAEPVRFQQMAGEPEDTVEVSIIVMLAVAEAKAQVQFLSRVISAIQDADLCAALLRAGDADELFQVLDRTGVDA